jgi:hypothetical protein
MPAFDENGDRTEVAQDVCDHGDVLVQVLDGSLVGATLAAKSFDLTDRVLRGAFVTAIVDRDIGARLRHAERDGASDAAAAAGDERRAPFE